MPAQTGGNQKVDQTLEVAWGPEHGARLRSQLRSLLQPVCGCAETLYDLILAVGEGYANAIEKEQPGLDRCVRVRVRADGKRANVVLDYPGEPFPLPDGKLPDPNSEHGRGVPIMLAYTDRLSYAFSRGRIHVTLEKRWP